ncbi:tail assembly chaperone [Gordonia phage Mariokart]|nr:tail assembly chaperone [Gordonia phage Mariokart]
MSAAKVTIEGSIQPCSELARGERRTVALTDRVQRLIRRGFVVVVDDHAPEPVAETDDLDAPEQGADAPKLNASRDEWAGYLDGLEPPIAYTDEDGRDDLVRLWQGRIQS